MNFLITTIILTVASIATAQTTTPTNSIPSSCTTSSAPFATMTYGGGKILSNPINVYGIFYGPHSDDTIARIGQFVNALGLSDRWAVDRTYTDNNGNQVTDNIKWVGAYHDITLTQGTDLSGKYAKLIDTAIFKSGWPKNDPAAIYSIFVGAGVKESTPTGRFTVAHMCTDYCGYHDKDTSGRLFTIVQDGVPCPGTLSAPGQCTGSHGCMIPLYRNHTDPTYSINGNQHSDSMITSLIHELGETVTNSDNRGYRDTVGNENADKCYKDFGVTSGEGSGLYNVDFSSTGGTKYLLQSQWSMSLNMCVLAV
ncbi:hypothetical protein HDU76_000698 [Blyttiomyces sp. JEL0837]|nr:hypothetical protein HDU76_000698 [Blyttiomyces sp. JEL0837]